jgi:hypothetical protein
LSDAWLSCAGPGELASNIANEGVPTTALTLKQKGKGIICDPTAGARRRRTLAENLAYGTGLLESFDLDHRALITGTRLQGSKLGSTGRMKEGSGIIRTGPKSYQRGRNARLAGIRGLMDHLPKVGIEVEFCRSGREGTRTIGLKKLRNLSSASSASSVDRTINNLDAPLLSSADRQPIVSDMSVGNGADSSLTIPLTITDDKTPPAKSLRLQQTDDTDDTDDRFRTSLGRGCWKCGSSDGEVGSYTIDVRSVNLHRSCVAFYRRDQLPHPSLPDLPTFLDRRPDREAS